MIEAIKKTIYAGLGATITTKEKVESILSELVKNGKLSANEAAEMAEKIANDSKKEFADTKENIVRAIDELIEKGKFVSQSEFDALKKRVETLEKSKKE
jgi:polyhydroxyalkanoate synthesis regulator phasin